MKISIFQTFYTKSKTETFDWFFQYSHYCLESLWLSAFRLYWIVIRTKYSEHADLHMRKILLTLRKIWRFLCANQTYQPFNWFYMLAFCQHCNALQNSCTLLYFFIHKIRISPTSDRSHHIQDFFM